MVVNVKIHGTLKDAATNSCDRVELAEGATVSDLLAAVGPSDCLADGSQVSIFARVSGG